MGRISKLVIKESVLELKNLMKKQSKSKNYVRLQSLIYLKENTFSTRLELSKYIGINLRTLERWLSQYRENGIEGLLLTKKRKRKSNLISERVHKGLEERVMDSEGGFSSYVEAKAWVKLEYGLDLKYNTIREHLVRHFKTKVKTARKSHTNKDPEAVNAFLKTP